MSIICLELFLFLCHICGESIPGGKRFPQALESGIRLKESGIPRNIEIRNPSSTDKDWNPEYTKCNLESKTILDSIPWGNDLVKVATYSARSRQSHGKIGDCQQLYDDIETSNLLPGFLSLKNI